MSACPDQNSYAGMSPEAAGRICHIIRNKIGAALGLAEKIKYDFYPDLSKLDTEAAMKRDAEEVIKGINLICEELNILERIANEKKNP